MKKSLLFLLLIGLITSCAKTEKTETRFMLNTEAIYQEMNMSASQTVLLLGKSSNGYFFSQKLESSNTPSKLMEIPNGSWTFYAFAWEAVGINEDNPQILSAGLFGGEVICGKSSSINLNGQSIDVDLNLSGNGCKNFGSFTENANGDFERFNKVVIESCTPIGVQGLVSQSNFTASIDVSNCLNQTDSQKTGYAASYRIQIKSQNNFEGVLSTDENSVLSSACVARHPDINITDQIAFNLPFGSSSSGLGINYTVKQYFNSADCGGEIFNNDDFNQNYNSNLPLIYHEEFFPSSLSSNEGRVVRFNTSNPSISKLAIKSSLNLVCANNASYGLMGGGAKKYYPQAGNGSATFPYVMCSPMGAEGSQWFFNATESSTIYPSTKNTDGTETCPYNLSLPGATGILKTESGTKNICLKTF